MGGEDLARGRLCGQPAERVLVLASPVGRYTPPPGAPDARPRVVVSLCRTHQGAL